MKFITNFQAMKTELEILRLRALMHSQQAQSDDSEEESEGQSEEEIVGHDVTKDWAAKVIQKWWLQNNPKDRVKQTEF